MSREALVTTALIAGRRGDEVVYAVPPEARLHDGKCPTCDGWIFRSNTLQCYACLSCWWWVNDIDVRLYGRWWEAP